MQRKSFNSDQWLLEISYVIKGSFPTPPEFQGWPPEFSAHFHLHPDAAQKCISAGPKVFPRIWVNFKSADCGLTFNSIENCISIALEKHKQRSITSVISLIPIIPPNFIFLHRLTLLATPHIPKLPNEKFFTLNLIFLCSSLIQQTVSECFSVRLHYTYPNTFHQTIKHKWMFKY